MPESNAGPLLAAHVIRLIASDQEKETGSREMEAGQHRSYAAEVAAGVEEEVCRTGAMAGCSG